MRKRLSAITVLGLAAVGLVPGAMASPDCGDVRPETLVFGPKVFVDTTRAGGEPVSVVAQDGSISVSAHSGTTHVYKDPAAVGGATDFGLGYTNQVLNWRSEDGGESWRYVGVAGLREGPHTATSTGFSDPDFSVDPVTGRIYNVEINLANVSVFSSDDDGQSYNLANPEAASGDRPWITATGKDKAFLYVNTLQQLLRTTDGGITWVPVGNGTGGVTGARVPGEGKLLVDPKNPTTGLIAPLGGFFRAPFLGIAISPDDGATWKEYRNPGLAGGQQFFGVIATDKAGNVYAASAGGYSGTGDRTANGFVEFVAFDRATLTWQEPTRIPVPDGDALWPWLAAGDEGRVGVAWLQSLADKPEQFHVYAATTQNALGSVVGCSDGSTLEVPVQWAVADASHTPVHQGPICLAGTNCNLSTGGAGDRRLGDFITANYDKDGNFFVVGGDTTLRNAVNGGAKPVSNPVFMKQVAGTPLLATPMTTRKTRCLANLPLC